MFDFTRLYMPEIFNARKVHKFQRTVREVETVYSRYGLPAVTVWFDDSCETYVFPDMDGDYQDFIKELSELSEEIQ